MKGLPDDFTRLVADICSDAGKIEGLLYREEMELLVLLAACPTADGEVLEIGSFKGRSTVLLAGGAKAAGQKKVVAVDPLVRSSVSDPEADHEDSWADHFRRNLAEHGVSDAVEFHQTSSRLLAEDWDRPIRLLWIDGDHTLPGVMADFDGFSPHVVPGGIVAMHDVRNPFSGPVRVFLKRVVCSDDFGAVGVCGTVGWGQKRIAPKSSDGDRDTERVRLRRWLRHLAGTIPRTDRRRGSMDLLTSRFYRLYRSLIPHGPVDPARWIASVECSGSAV